MTIAQTAQLMMSLQIAYPRYYADKTDADIDAAISLWHRLLGQYDYQLAEAAVCALIATQKFPPAVSEVIQQIQSLTAPEQMTELEAWRLVRRAIKGASMAADSRRMQGGALDPRTSAERNFEQLPPELQRLVGSPSQLAEWEKLDDGRIESVLQSNFMRSYTARMKRDREFEAMPPEIKALLRQASQSALKRIAPADAGGQITGREADDISGNGPKGLDGKETWA